MDSNAPIKYSDLFQPDNSITTLTGQLKDLADQYESLMLGIKAQAKVIRESIAGVSGATTQGQDVIKNASAQVDRLARSEMALAQSKSEVQKTIIENREAARENNNEIKQSIKLANSQEGSYNAVYAEYVKQNNILKTLSLNARKNTEEGRNQEKLVLSLRTKLKQLNEATGNHVLSVGEYGLATVSLASDIRNGTQTLTQMRVRMAELKDEGKAGGKEWLDLANKSQNLSKELRNLRRQYGLTKLEVNALGQQTRWLNDISAVAGSASGGLSAVTGALNLLGSESDTWAQSLVHVNSVVAITNGLSQAWNNIIKAGNILLVIRNIQAKANTAAQNLQTKSTIAATVAQAALNAVASANPFVLLAIAIGAVVGGLALWIKLGSQTLKQQEIQNRETEASINFMKEYDKLSTRLSKENQKALEQELETAKARKAGYGETQAIENKIQAAKERTNEILAANHKEEIDNLDENLIEMGRLAKELENVKKAAPNSKVEVQLDAEGPVERFKASKVIDKLQKKFDLLKEKVQIATEIKYDQQQLDADAKALKEQHKQELLQIEELERSTLRGAQDVQIGLIKQRFDKERAAERANIARSIEDIQVKLRTENNLTTKARRALNMQMVNLRKQLAQNLEDIENEENKANIDAVRELEDTRLRARRETAEKQRDVLRMNYTREIEDLEMRLKSERGLTEKEQAAILNRLYALREAYQRDVEDLDNKIILDQLDKESTAIENRIALVSEGTTEELNLRLQALENQRQAELTNNKTLAEDLRQDEASINAKYDRLAKKARIESETEMSKASLDANQAYEESVFNLKMHSESQVAKFQLKQQKERLKAELNAQKQLLAIQTGEQRKITETTIKTIENEIKAIDSKMKAAGKVNNIWELFGFNSDAADAAQTIADQVLGMLSDIAQGWVDAADAAVQAADKEVEAAQKALDYELEARANGYANNVIQAQKELELEKNNQRKALAEKEKAQRAQMAIDTLTQASSLITASANIWAGFTAIKPAPLGLALAIAGLTTLWGSFAVSKAKAFQVAGTGKESYGEGTVELLSGGSHQSGNDVDLGSKSDGTKRRAEGGEFFAVINKRNSRRYRDIIPDVINSFNSGTFAQRYVQASNAIDGLVSSSFIGIDTSRLEKDVRDIKEQNARTRYVDGSGNIVETYKNLRQTILKS